MKLRFFWTLAERLPLITTAFPSSRLQHRPLLVEICLLPYDLVHLRDAMAQTAQVTLLLVLEVDQTSDRLIRMLLLILELVQHLLALLHLRRQTLNKRRAQPVHLRAHVCE